MAVTKNVISPSLLPLQGATLKLTPYKPDGSLDYPQAIMNNKSIAGTLSISKTVTSDTIANERGDDLELPNTRKFNVVVNMNSFDPLFHDAITDKVVTVSSDTALMSKVESKNVIKSGTVGSEVYDITVEKTPVVDENGVMVFHVEDAQGNVYQKVETAVGITEGQYSVDALTKKISFAAEDSGKLMTIQYLYAGTKVREAKENPLMVTKFYQMEIMDTVRSADDGSLYNSYAKFEKVQVTGDINELSKQKSPNSPMAYNFTTAPIPVGKSPYITRLEPQAI